MLSNNSCRKRRFHRSIPLLTRASQVNNSMSDILVKLADSAVSNNPNDTLFVYGIGSTLAVILYDEKTKVGGMLHFMFSSTAASSLRTEDCPFMYADRGIPGLVKSCTLLGARQDALSAMLAGGSIMLGKGIAQSVSDSNIYAAKTILLKMGIEIVAENTGGHQMRSVRLDIATGKTYLKQPGSNWMELC